MQNRAWVQPPDRPNLPSSGRLPQITTAPTACTSFSTTSGQQTPPPPIAPSWKCHPPAARHRQPELACWPALWTLGATGKINKHKNSIINSFLFIFRDNQFQFYFLKNPMTILKFRWNVKLRDEFMVLIVEAHGGKRGVVGD
jgi:hypothetical protein